MDFVHVAHKLAAFILEIACLHACVSIGQYQCAMFKNLEIAHEIAGHEFLFGSKRVQCANIGLDVSMVRLADAEKGPCLLCGAFSSHLSLACTASLFHSLWFPAWLLHAFRFETFATLGFYSFGVCAVLRGQLWLVT